ncbi:MAG: hypothetical protein KA116_11060 [Proteobacteria bacterium]|nr:hypothetical protein [Pseudomonadota bacterium]
MAAFSKKFLSILTLSLILGAAFQASSLRAEDDSPRRVFFGIDFKKVKNLKPNEVMEALSYLPLPLPIKAAISAALIGAKIYPMVKADPSAKANPAAHQSSDIIAGLDSADVATIKAVLPTFLGQFTKEDNSESQAKLAGLIVSVIQTKNIDNMLVALKEIIAEEAYPKNSERQADQSKKALVSMIVNLYEGQGRLVDIVKMTNSEDVVVAGVAYLKMLDRWTNLSAVKVAADIKVLRQNESEIGREELDTFLIKIKGEESFKATLINSKVVGLFEGLNAGKRWTEDTYANAKNTAQGYREALGMAATSAAEQVAAAAETVKSFFGALRGNAASKFDALKAGGASKGAAALRVAQSIGKRFTAFAAGCEKDLTEGVADDGDNGRVIDVEVILLPAPGETQSGQATPSEGAGGGISESNG